MAAKKVLITGVSGLVGGAIYLRLAQCDAQDATIDGAIAIAY